MDETPDIPIRRPLDIGMEVLPDGVSALDFMHYELIPLPKQELYRKDQVPPHELMGDKAIIRREFLEEEPIQHSELWKAIVSKIHPDMPELILNEKPKEKEKFLPCHLVDQPSVPNLLPSLIPRKLTEEGEDWEDRRMANDDSLRVSEKPMLNLDALAKLKETVNWLELCDKEDEMDDPMDDDTKIKNVDL